MNKSELIADQSPFKKHTGGTGWSDRSEAGHLHSGSLAGSVRLLKCLTRRHDKAPDWDLKWGWGSEGERGDIGKKQIQESLRYKMEKRSRDEGNREMRLVCV